MRFKVKGKIPPFEGQIVNYDGLTGKKLSLLPHEKTVYIFPKESGSLTQGSEFDTNVGTHALFAGGSSTFWVWFIKVACYRLFHQFALNGPEIYYE